MRGRKGWWEGERERERGGERERLVLCVRKQNRSDLEMLVGLVHGND